MAAQGTRSSAPTARHRHRARDPGDPRPCRPGLGNHNLGRLFIYQGARGEGQAMPGDIGGDRGVSHAYAHPQRRIAAKSHLLAHPTARPGHAVQPALQSRRDVVPAIQPCSSLARISAKPGLLSTARRPGIRIDFPGSRPHMPAARLRGRTRLGGLHRLPERNFCRGSSEHGQRAVTEPRIGVADSAPVWRKRGVVGDDI